MERRGWKLESGKFHDAMGVADGGFFAPEGRRNVATGGAESGRRPDERNPWKEP